MSPLVSSGRCRGGAPGPGEGEQAQRLARRPRPRPRRERRDGRGLEPGLPARRVPPADPPPLPGGPQVGEVLPGPAARRLRATGASGVRAARPSGHSSQRTGWAMLGTVHSRTPPGRSTRAHSRSTAAGSGTYSSTLAATTASRLPAANGSVRQRGLEPDPADGVLAGRPRRPGAASAVRCRSRSPGSRRPPGAGRAPRCRSQGRALRRRRRPGHPPRRRAGSAARRAGRPARTCPASRPPWRRTALAPGPRGRWVRASVRSPMTAR